MGFTSKALLTPIVGMLLGFIIHQTDAKSKIGDGLAMVSMVWLWIAIPVVVLYWLVRVFRRATRDSHDQQFPR